MLEGQCRARHRPPGARGGSGETKRAPMHRRRPAWTARPCSCPEIHRARSTAPPATPCRSAGPAHPASARRSWSGAARRQCRTCWSALRRSTGGQHAPGASLRATLHQRRRWSHPGAAASHATARHLAASTAGHHAGWASGRRCALRCPAPAGSGAPARASLLPGAKSESARFAPATARPTRGGDLPPPAQRRTGTAPVPPPTPPAAAAGPAATTACAGSAGLAPAVAAAGQSPAAVEAAAAGATAAVVGKAWEWYGRCWP